MRHGYRRLWNRLRGVLPAVLVLALSEGLLRADTVLFKDGRKLEGEITAETADEIELTTAARIHVRIPRADVERIEYDYDRTVVEVLAPSQPNRYFAVGRELTRSDKEMAQELGQQLIRRAIFLDKGKYYVSGNLALGELEARRKDGNPACYYKRVLLLDPENTDARAKLDVLAQRHASEPSAELIGRLQGGVRAYLDGRAAEAVQALGKVSDVPPSLLPPIAMESLTQHCQQYLKGLCSVCKGTGKEPCRVCGGAKNVTTYAWFGWLRGNAKQRDVTCPRCEKASAKGPKPPPAEAPQRLVASSLGCPYCEGQRKVSFRRLHASFACSTCDGDGKIRSTRETSRRCSRCGGNGYRTLGFGMGTSRCSTCGGEGLVDRTTTALLTCNSCRGSGLRCTNEELEARTVGPCFQCDGAGTLPCGPCKGLESPLTVSPEHRAKLEDYLKALGSRDPLALHGPKMPLIGQLEFDEDEEYSKMYFKDGKWHREKPPEPKENP